tara:strand:+ start:64 stop:948 length:885 start_codon:yes stop_codon:yes gene_type:complete
MSNARNLADLLGTSTKANQVISTSGAITTTGAFTSPGIDDNGDATTITLDANEDITAANGIYLSGDLTSLTVDKGGIDRSGNTTRIISARSGGNYADMSINIAGADLSDGNSGMNRCLYIDYQGNTTIDQGNLVLGTSGKGISFAATSDATTMSSELLSDYEEGMWNATLAPQTSGSVTVAGGTDGCQYTRIGKMVFLSGLIQISSVSSPNGVLRMSGFPYAVADLDDYGGRTLATINIQAGAIPPNNYGMWINEGDSYGSIYNFTDSEQPQSGASANFSGNESIYFSIMYRTS